MTLFSEIDIKSIKVCMLFYEVNKLKQKLNEKNGSGGGKMYQVSEKREICRGILHSTF